MFLYTKYTEAVDIALKFDHNVLVTVLFDFVNVGASFYFSLHYCGIIQTRKNLAGITKYDLTTKTFAIGSIFLILISNQLLKSLSED